MLTLDRVPATAVITQRSRNQVGAVTTKETAIPALGIDRFERTSDVRMQASLPRVAEGTVVPEALIQLSIFHNRRHHWQAEKAWWEAFQVTDALADALAIAHLAFWEGENRAIAAQALDRAVVLAKSAADCAALARAARNLARTDLARQYLDQAYGMARTAADFLAYADAASSIDHMGNLHSIETALKNGLVSARTSGDYTAVVRFAALNPLQNREMIAEARRLATDAAQTSADYSAVAQFAYLDPLGNRDLIRHALGHATSLAATGEDFALLATVASIEPLAHEDLIKRALEQGISMATTAKDYVDLARIASITRTPDRDRYMHVALARAEAIARTPPEWVTVAEVTAYDPLAGHDDQSRRLQRGYDVAQSAGDYWHFADMARFGSDPRLQNLAKTAIQQAFQALPNG